MLNICSSEFNKIGLKFNVDKCVALYVDKSVGHVVQDLVLYSDVILRA